MFRVRLESPYGGLRTPGGGWIENGREGTVLDDTDFYTSLQVKFDEEVRSVTVPIHWRTILNTDESEKSNGSDY